MNQSNRTFIELLCQVFIFFGQDENQENAEGVKLTAQTPEQAFAELKGIVTARQITLEEEGRTGNYDHLWDVAPDGSLQFLNGTILHGGLMITLSESMITFVNSPSQEECQRLPKLDRLYSVFTCMILVDGTVQIDLPTAYWLYILEDFRLLRHFPDVIVPAIGFDLFFKQIEPLAGWMIAHAELESRSTHMKQLRSTHADDPLHLEWVLENNERLMAPYLRWLDTFVLAQLDLVLPVQ